MTELLPSEHIGLVHAFSELDRSLDVMIVDTAAGIADGVLTFCQAAQDIIVVVCDEPASITDAYALIKKVSLGYARKNEQLGYRADFLIEINP